METYKNLKKGTKIGLVITSLLVIGGMVFTLISLYIRILNGSDLVAPFFQDSVNLLIYFFVLIYAFAAYKKPHGNMLRTLFFAFGVNLAVQCILPKPINGAPQIISSLCLVLGALFVAYIAGRLNRIKQNKILLTVAGILLLGSCLRIVGQDFEIRRLINSFEPIIIHAALSFAYTARYEEHKAAGLEDK